MKKIVVLFLILFVGIEVTKAQILDREAKELTLTQAINTALANATDIKQALFDIESADQDILVSWGEVAPTVDTDIGYQRNLEIPVNFLPGEFFGGQAGTFVPVQFGTDNNWTGGFTISQTLFRGEAFVGIATADLYKTAQEENKLAVAQQVVTNTRLAYYSVLIAIENYRLEQLNIARLRKNLSENQARVKAGLVDDYDVLRLQVQLKNQEPALMTAKNAIDEAYRNLNIAIGIPVSVPFSIVGELKDFKILDKEASNQMNEDLKKVDQATPIQFLTNDRLEPILEKNRGDLRSLKVTSLLQDQRIFADKTNFLPNLSASYSMRWNAVEPGAPNFFGSEDQRARSQVIGINFRWNLFNGFKQYTALQKSVIQKKKIDENRRFATESAINQVLTAQDRLQNLFDLAPSVLEALSLAETGYNRVLKRQKNGLSTQLDVTDAELQLKQAELNYANLVYNYLSAKAQYDYSIGQVPIATSK